MIKRGQQDFPVCRHRILNAGPAETVPARQPWLCCHPAPRVTAHATLPLRDRPMSSTAAVAHPQQPCPPGPLADPRLHSIYHRPDPVRNIARLAAVLLAEPGRERTCTELAGKLPGTAPGSLHAYLGRLADAGYLAARPAAEVQMRGNNPPLAYSVTLPGKAGLSQYLRDYRRQVEELDHALAAAGISQPGPGSRSQAPAPLPTPAGARVLLHFCTTPGLRDHLSPCPLSDISAAVTPATGMQRDRLRAITRDLVGGRWLAPGDDPRPGKTEFTVTLTSIGRDTFPASGARLRWQLARMSREVSIPQAQAEAGI